MTFHLRVPLAQEQEEEEDGKDWNEFKIHPRTGTLSPDMQQIVEASNATVFCTTLKSRHTIV